MNTTELPWVKLDTGLGIKSVNISIVMGRRTGLKQFPRKGNPLLNGFKTAHLDCAPWTPSEVLGFYLFREQTAVCD